MEKVITAAAVGGGNYNSGQCNPTATNPKCGDGQDRLKQAYRFNGSDSVYSWLPYYTTAKTKMLSNTSISTTREVSVNFKWNSAALSNLNIDANEAIEAEVLFNNYGPSTGIPANGKGFMTAEPYYWDTKTTILCLDTSKNILKLIQETVIVLVT
ncbi:hypothetical protein ACOI1C_09020 [Bacillus sp. DJP31]|uniref:hypothetical protein n=1 Tax=Bacillus sp. DJP31 TaxID=3409789 RepID=UPI003BB6B594